MAQKKYVSFTRLEQYHEKEVARTAAEVAAALQEAKEYAEGLGDNYDSAGAAATAEANAKAYADGKDAAIAEAKKAGTDAQAAADAADAKAVAAQTAADEAKAAVSAHEKYVGTLPTTATSTDIVGYIDEKTAGIATSENLEALTNRVTQAETDIDNIEKDYLKAADKTELVGKIGEVQTAVDTEKSRAEGIEAGLRTDVDAIKADYLKAADKTELQGNIDTLTGVVNTLRDGVDADKVDGVKDLIDYVEEHGTEVTGMKEDISENAGAIAGVAERMTTAEGKITAVEGAVATKAEQSALEQEAADREAGDSALDKRIKAVEDKFGTGEGSVEDLIADAISEEVTRVDGELAKKVDKVEGKGLSTNDLTNELKEQYDAAYAHSQVAHAPADAQKNIIETVKVNGTAVTVTDKAVDIAVPTDNAQLTNGAGYLVASDIANKADKATTLAGYGITDAYTSAQTDSAIATAIGQFVECSEEDVNGLFA